MTNEQMKTILANNGVAEADIEKVNDKFDAEKITEIIEAANNPKEAFENLHAFYPELDVSKLEEQMNFIQEQFDAAAKEKNNKDEVVELTENELEHVSGGADSGQSSNNWKKIAICAAIVLGTALVFGGLGAGAGAILKSLTAEYFIYGGSLMGAAAAGAGVGAAIGGLIGGGIAGCLVEKGKI